MAIQAFKPNTTYACRSIGDHNCIWSFVVVRRTAKCIWIQEDGKTTVERRGIYVYDDIEKIRPFGTYSLCPVLSADKIVPEPVDEEEPAPSNRKTYDERKSDYEDKQDAKEERYSNAADNARGRSDAAYKAAKSVTDNIPFGQPILVGHHSEKADRNRRDRAHNNFGKSIAEGNKADYYAAKAAAVGTDAGGIKTEDPDAIKKLKSELDSCEQSQVLMKAANKIIKSKKLSDEDKVGQLTELGIPKAATLLEPDFCGRVGFASYSLSNNNANIRRLKERLKDLEFREQQENQELEFGDITVSIDYDDNRVRLLFPGKPDEDVRSKLKSNGFRWSPRNGAWQRHISNHAIRLATDIAKEVAA